MRICVVPKCNVSDVTLFGFPKQDELRSQWVNFVRSQDSALCSWLPDKDSFICFKHFKSNDFKNFAMVMSGHATRLVLIPMAVPSICVGDLCSNVQFHNANFNNSTSVNLPTVNSLLPSHTASTSVEPACKKRKLNRGTQYDYYCLRAMNNVKKGTSTKDLIKTVDRGIYLQPIAYLFSNFIDQYYTMYKFSLAVVCARNNYVLVLIM